MPANCKLLLIIKDYLQQAICIDSSKGRISQLDPG